ncbi:hypothetical protein [Paludibacter sp. 221]|nr:hypothetical protein [Paludibacter sp. 221]
MTLTFFPSPQGEGVGGEVIKNEVVKSGLTELIRKADCKPLYGKKPYRLN